MARLAYDLQLLFLNERGTMSQVFFESNSQQFRTDLRLNLSVAPSFKEGADLIRSIAERGLAVVLLVLVSPLIALCSIAVSLTSPGPVIYRQTRVGKNGLNFTIYKIRTMRLDAEAKTGPVLSVQSDNRITSIGKFLRNSHLDELPQLFNVLRGEMSFIGPRPERPEFVSIFNSSIPGFSRRTQVKPGITGLAQICGGYDLPAEEKLEYDLAYIQEKDSFKLNAFIVWNTLRKLVRVRYNV